MAPIKALEVMEAIKAGVEENGEKMVKQIKGVIQYIIKGGERGACCPPARVRRAPRARRRRRPALGSRDRECDRDDDDARRERGRSPRGAAGRRIGRSRLSLDMGVKSACARG